MRLNQTDSSWMLSIIGRFTPLIAAILIPLSSVTVQGFVTFAVSWAARHTN